MPDKRKIQQQVNKARDNLERTRLPALNKLKQEKRAELSQANDPMEKKAIKSELDYIDARIKAAKAGVVVREDEVEEDAPAGQGAVTTTSVGNAASPGGSANYAPHMGTMSRKGYKKPPKKHKKKNSGTREFVEFYLDEK